MNASDRNNQAEAGRQTKAFARKKREPLMHIIKRTETPITKKASTYALFFLFALMVGALLLVIIGKNPIRGYASMATGSFGSATSAAETIKRAVPLLIASIALTFSFKMKFWNIGGEGQILAGATLASYIVIWSIHHSNPLPSGVFHLLMILVSLLGGALFAFFPAFFKSKWGTNETLFTLMLNYCAIRYIEWLEQQHAWQDPFGRHFPIILDFDRFTEGKVVLPKLLGVHIGWIAALVITVAAYFYMKKTKQGYEIDVVGDSLETARYAGMNTRWIQIRTLVLSGALCGFVGYLQVAGADHTLSGNTAAGVGFTAIIVAWLSKLNPFVMIAVSVFIAMLQKGSLSIQSTMNVPASVADLLTGIILFFMLAGEFFIEYRVIFHRRKDKHASSVNAACAEKGVSES